MVPASIEQAILAGDLHAARLFLFDADPLTSAIERGLYHVLFDYRHEFKVDVYKPSIRQAAHAQDNEALVLICYDNYPMSSAALRNDWDMVHRLVAYGCDPNHGPSFMKRPLPVAILSGQLEEAHFLLSNYATRDLGDQLHPLREAIIHQNVADAQDALLRPRILKLVNVETKRQTLQRNFLEVYKVFQAGSQSRGVSQEFEDFGDNFGNHRALWRKDMTGVRRMIKNRSPKNLRQVIGLLCVASAMCESISESLSIQESFGSYDLFIEDLDRWKQLAILPHQHHLFDEIASAVWGKRESSARTPDFLYEQQEDRNRLFGMIQKLVERFSRESSLPLDSLDNVEEFWDYDHPSDSTSIRLFQPKRPQNDEGVSRDRPQNKLPAEATAYPDPAMKDPREYSGWKPGLITFLMMGAIFTCIISFMFAFHTGSFFLATSRDIPTLLNTSHWAAVYESLKNLPFTNYESIYLEAGESIIMGRLQSLEAIRSFICGQAQMQLNTDSMEVLDTSLRGAATSILATLEGWALQDRYALTESFLKTWEPRHHFSPSNPDEREISDNPSQTSDSKVSDSEITIGLEDNQFFVSHHHWTAWQTPSPSSKTFNHAFSTSSEADSWSKVSASTSDPSASDYASIPTGKPIHGSS